MSENVGTEPSLQAAAALSRSGPVYAALTGLTSLAILLQAVFAGEVINPDGASGWLNAHNVNADVVIALALLTAIYAVVMLRDAARSLMIGSTVLAVLVIVQTAIGHAITDNNDNGLLVIHVPLAMLAFGLTIWLSVRARTLRRSAGG